MKFKTNSSRLLSLLLILMFQSAPALANYDERCLVHLLKTEEQKIAFDHVRSSWLPGLIFQLPARIPGPVEYEGWMDLNHGLPLIGTFETGKKSAFMGDSASMRELVQRMKKSELKEVAYLPGSLKKLGDMYKQACILLERPGCEVYDDYKGLSSEAVRPFTAVEEQALKWATFHLISGAPMARTMTEALKSRRTTEEKILATHIHAEEYRTDDARLLIFANFKPEDAVPLFTQLVQPYISTSFARTLALFKGNRMN